MCQQLFKNVLIIRKGVTWEYGLTFKIDGSSDADIGVKIENAKMSSETHVGAIGCWVENKWEPSCKDSSAWLNTAKEWSEGSGNKEDINFTEDNSVFWRPVGGFNKDSHAI